MGILDRIKKITGLGNRDIAKEKDDFDEKVKRLLIYYTDLVTCLNDTAKNTTPYITFAEPESSQINNLAGKIPSLEYFEDGFEKIYPEQIRSAWNVMVSLIRGETQEHVTGLTQLGKNGLITVLLDFIGIVAAAYDENDDRNEDRTDRLLLPVAWLPNAINMEKQSIEKFKQSMLLNNIIQCHIGAEVHTVGHLHYLINNGVKEQILKTIDDGPEGDIAKHKFKALVDDFFTDDSAALVLRRSMAKDQFYRWLFKGAHLSGRKIVLIMDESHIAIGKNQGADKLLNAPVNETLDFFGMDDQAEKSNIEQEENETKEILNSYQKIFKNEAKLVTISATNLPFTILKYNNGKVPVYLEVASGYCGFKFVDGKDYPLGEAIVHSPIVEKISEIAKKFELQDLEFLNLRTLDHAFGFGLYMMSKDWQKICEKLNANIPIICSKLKEKFNGDFELDGRGINRAAKILAKIKSSKAEILVKLFGEILNECEMPKFLELNEFGKLFSEKTEGERRKYLKNLADKKDSRLEKGWKLAIKKAQISLGDLLEYLLIKKNPQNKNGCILRWECLNQSYDNFIKELADKRFKGKICFIPYMDENAKSTVSEILKTSNPNNLPYLISVTGRGRYGESYPKDCGYAIDCTTKNSTASSFFQSLLGRLTGYGKYDINNVDNTKPLLILSDLAYEKIFLELLNGKGWSPKVGTGKDLVKTGLDFKPIEIICVDRGLKELDQLFNSIDNVLAEFPGASFRQLHSKVQKDFFELIEPFCDLIEKSPQKFTRGVSKEQSIDGLEQLELIILRPGQEDEKGRQLDWEGRGDKQDNRPKNARTFVAYESKNEKLVNGSRRFGLDSERNRLGKVFLHIGFQINEIGGKKHLQSFYLWLKKPIRSSVSGPTDGALETKPGTVPGNLIGKMAT